MCNCENIEVVGVRRGDTLVFFVDTDYYDMEDISEVMESVKEAFPTTKVLMLPDDMIADIKIFREDDPLVAVEMKVANTQSKLNALICHNISIEIHRNLHIIPNGISQEYQS